MIVNGIDICDRQGCDQPVEPRPCRLDRFCPPHQREWDDNYDNYVDPLRMYRNEDRIKTHD